MTQIDQIHDTCGDGCCAPPPLVLPTPSKFDRTALIREVFRLEWLTVGWMLSLIHI